MLKKWYLACALLLLPTAASPMYVTAEMLIRACESKTAVHREFCNSYLLGVVDTHETMQLWDNLNRGPLFCIGKGVVGEVLRKQVIKYAKQHPDLLKTPGSSFVVTALSNEFPCQQPQP